MMRLSEVWSLSNHCEKMITECRKIQAQVSYSIGSPNLFYLPYLSRKAART